MFSIYLHIKYFIYHIFLVCNRDIVCGCRLDAYLAAAAELARRQWTQFRLAPMALGVALLASAAVVQLWMCWKLLPASGASAWLPCGLSHPGLWSYD